MIEIFDSPSDGEKMKAVNLGDDGRIDDIEKARRMAEAEDPFRTQLSKEMKGETKIPESQMDDVIKLAQSAEKAGRIAGENYDKRKNQERLIEKVANGEELTEEEQSTIEQYDKQARDREDYRKEALERQNAEEKRDQEIEELSADTGEYGELYRSKYKEYIKSKADKIRELHNYSDASEVNKQLDSIEYEAREYAYKAVKNERERGAIEDRLRAFDKIINEE